MAVASVEELPDGEAFVDVEDFSRTVNAWVAQIVVREIIRGRLLGLLPTPAGTMQTGSMHVGPRGESEASVSSFPAAQSMALLDENEAIGHLLQHEAATRNVVYSEPLRRAAEAVDAAERLLKARIIASRAHGISLPFFTLCDRFQLSDPQAVLLLVIVAAATEARVRRLFTVLQNDANKTRPTAGVALTLLSPNTVGANLPWHLLDPGGRLRFYNLITVGAGGRETRSSLMDRPIAVPDSLAAFIARGELWLDEHLAGIARLVSPTHDFDSLFMPAAPKAELARRIRTAAIRVHQSGESAGVLLRGTVGSGRKTAALALCKEQGLRLLVVDTEQMPSDEESVSQVFRTLVRDARLFQAVPFFENAEALSRESANGAARLRSLANTYRGDPGLMFFSTEREDRLPLEEVLTLSSLSIPALSKENRIGLWNTVLPPELNEGGAVAATLAERFPVNPGDIVPIGADVRALEKAEGTTFGVAEIGRLVLDRSRHNLRAIATQVRTNHDVADVVLPQDLLDRCLRIVQFVEAHSDLRDSWGLGKKLLTSSGVSALFSGPPGTGKTMMAGIIGKRLGLDVFRIDISKILSKWIGETEKNLSRLFDEATRTRAVLVFDEADALFSKRTDVKSATDRYSNVEVNYLLQKMESFEGIIILTTNLASGLDEAFVRRIQFKLRFLAPTVEERQEIWRRMMPAEVSLDEDVDLEELARRFTLSGGYIKNAVIRASYIAYARAKVPCLQQSDFLQAIDEETEEAGRLV